MEQCVDESGYNWCKAWASLGDATSLYDHVGSFGDLGVCSISMSDLCQETRNHGSRHQPLVINDELCV